MWRRLAHAGRGALHIPVRRRVDIVRAEVLRDEGQLLRAARGIQEVRGPALPLAVFAADLIATRLRVVPEALLAVDRQDHLLRPGLRPAVRHASRGERPEPTAVPGGLCDDRAEDRVRDRRHAIAEALCCHGGRVEKRVVAQGSGLRAARRAVLPDHAVQRAVQVVEHRGDVRGARAGHAVRVAGRALQDVVPWHRAIEAAPLEGEGRRIVEVVGLLPPHGDVHDAARGLDLHRGPGQQIGALQRLLRVLVDAAPRRARVLHGQREIADERADLFEASVVGVEGAIVDRHQPLRVQAAGEDRDAPIGADATSRRAARQEEGAARIRIRLPGGVAPRVADEGRIHDDLNVPRQDLLPNAPADKAEAAEELVSHGAAKHGKVIVPEPHRAEVDPPPIEGCREAIDHTHGAAGEVLLRESPVAAASAAVAHVDGLQAPPTVVHRPIEVAGDLREVLRGRRFQIRVLLEEAGERHALRGGQQCVGRGVTSVVPEPLNRRLPTVVVVPRVALEVQVPARAADRRPQEPEASAEAHDTDGGVADELVPCVHDPEHRGRGRVADRARTA
mmetsp:Transcript_105989/g.306542  ORF Transcript_105989/g.306542 Transcript_105989/m.306542 type:complete len:562 (-) Transcript_105989:629-2314(-)